MKRFTITIYSPADLWEKLLDRYYDEWVWGDHGLYAQKDRLLVNWYWITRKRCVYCGKPPKRKDLITEGADAWCWPCMEQESQVIVATEGP